MRQDLTFFKTLGKSNVVFLKNPSKTKTYHSTGANKGKIKKIQQIQYSDGFPTIIKEEITKIDPNAKPLSLFTKKGVFRVSEDDIYLLEFLRATDQNEANGGTIFKEVNVANDEAFEIDAFEAYDKAINALMRASDNEVRALAMEFISPAAVNQSIQKTKITLRRNLNNSDKLVEALNLFMAGKVADEKLLIAIALKEGIIEIKEGKKVHWANNGELFFTASQSKDVNSELSVWLKNDTEGRVYLKAISDKMPKGDK